jgi:cell division protein FtsA
MIRAKRDNLVVGLDIGTTKICAMVGEMRPGGVELIGIGTSPSRGLRKGMVINIEATTHSIRHAIDEAQRMAGVEIQSVYAGIAGSHMRGFNSQGVVAIKNGEVEASDIDRVIDAAKAVAIPVDREVIHALPQEFIVDDQDGIREPLGISGVRLEAKVHIVTGAVSCAQNIVKCAERCGLKVQDIVLEQLASAYAVLTEDEKELGAALVDIGGGTTDIAIFSKGAIQHTAVIAIGGQHLTNDIAVGLRTPAEDAENIKKRFGQAASRMIGSEEVIEVPGIGNRPERILRRQILGDILEPRVQEICELVAREIERLRVKDLLASGIVLSGGSSLLPGIVEMTEEWTGLPTRCGVPQHVGGLSDVVKSPIYATAVGLVLYGARQMDAKHLRWRDDGMYSKVKRRMTQWLQDMI